jgi:hypothetical protein
VTHALKHALNLFDSGSSASDGETAHLEQPQKRSRETPLPKGVPKSFMMIGIFD